MNDYIKTVVVLEIEYFYYLCHGLVVFALGHLCTYFVAFSSNVQVGKKTTSVCRTLDCLMRQTNNIPANKNMF